MHPPAALCRYAWRREVGEDFRTLWRQDQHGSPTVEESIAMAGRHISLAFILLGILCCTSQVNADTKGKLSGRVVDQRNDPVVRANVTILGTTQGAAADEDGYYVILNIPAGKYDVRFSAVGYQSRMVKDVVINADQSTLLNVSISEALIESGEVTSIAEKPLVDTRQTSSVAILARDKIDALPVQNLNDVVNLQAGVVDGHFRGGRAGEVQYQVDGVSVNNPFDNSSVIQLDKSVLQEVQVISGTFDAEFGQAMSGVVNCVLRSGSDEYFQGSAEVYGGGYLVDGADRNLYQHVAVMLPPAVQSYTVSLSGPLPLPQTSFLANVRRSRDDGYLYGANRFDPSDASDFSSRQFRPTGDNSAVPLGRNEEWSGQFKIANHSFGDIQLSYQAVFSAGESQGNNFAYRFNPNGQTTQRRRSLVHGVDWTQTLSPSSFFSLSIRQNYFSYSDYAFASITDEHYAQAGAPRGDANYELGAIIQGYDLGRFEQKTNALLVKGSYTSQVSSTHLLKCGFEVQVSALSFGSPGTLGGITLDGTHSQIYVVADSLAQNTRSYSPTSVALYVQDRVEFAHFLVRAGLRVESYDARATVPSNLENPANAIAGAPTSVPLRTTRKFAVAPRLGISYPIAAGGAMYFSWGYFYQMPAMGNMYANSDYSILRNLQSGSTRYGVMGNPNIKPEFTAQYEFGFKQQFAQTLGVDLSVYYKDIRDLLGVEFVDTYADSRYARFTNVDFGSVYGVKLTIDYQLSAALSFSLNYTYQNALGNSSDPRETADRASAGADPRPRQMPFDWDQRHTLNLSAALMQLDDYQATVIVRCGTGSPYTPAVGSGFGAALEKNSSAKPGWALVDVRGEKTFTFGSLRLNTFLRVLNVFDARYSNGFVFSTTGSPLYTLTPPADAVALINPARFAAPRRVELGAGCSF